ncbi:MAG TPA: AMP-binding protein [Steroidobacteraceae bacterium]
MAHSKSLSSAQAFIRARDQLLSLRDDPRAARRDFRWPDLETFNWATDYFDPLARGNDAPALRVVSDTAPERALSFAQLACRSSQVANFLTAQGLGPGDRVLLMLGNAVPLWETMLAAIRLGAVIVPATTLLGREELRDRLERGHVKAIVTHESLVERFAGLEGAPVRIAVSEESQPHASAPGTAWVSYTQSHSAPELFASGRPTRADDLLLLYFTSGTTALPKLVAHTHTSYPVGHLSTMYWLGLRPGDVHLNLSSAGWAKHAWSSFFAPWNAGACILSLNQERFAARAVLDQLVRCEVTTFCAPPTVWRLLIQQDIGRWGVRLREAASAGEPLNPEVIERVRVAWGVVIRDGYGQTETSAQIGNPPGAIVKPGSMGQPLPGYRIALLDPSGVESEEGEICIDMADRPLGLMSEYLDDAQRNTSAMRDGYYHTGDVARRGADDYLTYVGRADDVFKSSDYRISPFELESILIEHPAVVEAAVVPSPDPVRLAVPKAFVTLKPDRKPNRETASSIFEHIRERLSPFKRVRRLEFGPLPKTISGKIRRIELRQVEEARSPDAPRRPNEFWEEDCSGPRS